MSLKTTTMNYKKMFIYKYSLNYFKNPFALYKK